MTPTEFSFIFFHTIKTPQKKKKLIVRFFFFFLNNYNCKLYLSILRLLNNLA